MYLNVTKNPALKTIIHKINNQKFSKDLSSSFYQGTSTFIPQIPLIKEKGINMIWIIVKHFMISLSFVPLSFSLLSTTVWYVVLLKPISLDEYLQISIAAARRPSKNFTKNYYFGVTKIFFLSYL